jgi:hypothetical protein
VLTLVYLAPPKKEKTGNVTPIRGRQGPSPFPSDPFNKVHDKKHDPRRILIFFSSGKKGLRSNDEKSRKISMSRSKLLKALPENK